MHESNCCPKKVQKLYTKRKKEGRWNKDEERDDQKFLNMKRKIYKEMSPLNEGVFSGDEGSQEDSDFEDVSADGGKSA